MSYYCCRRRHLQYTIKATLCLRVQSHMWQTVAAFMGLTSLFGVPLSLQLVIRKAGKICVQIHTSWVAAHRTAGSIMSKEMGFPVMSFRCSIHDWKKGPGNKKIGWVFGYTQTPECRVWYEVAGFKLCFLSLVTAMLGTSVPNLVLQYQKVK